MINGKPAGNTPRRQTLRPLGVPELVELLFEINRDRVEALTCRDDFPAPIADLATGAIWDRADIDAWLAQHGPAVPELLRDAHT